MRPEPSIEHELRSGVLLRFLAPGLIHGLSNQIFVLCGAAHPRAQGQVPPEAIESAGQRCVGQLAILRTLTSETGARDSLGSVLTGVLDAAGVVFREAGVSLDVAFETDSAEQVVALRDWIPAIVACLVGLHDRLNGALPGRVLACARADDSGVTIHFGYESGETTLPFPIDWSIAAEKARRLMDFGGFVEPGDGLVLRGP